MGHEWKAIINSVINLGTWRPHCRETPRKITERISL
jgi:hypothetical protein